MKNTTLQPLWITISFILAFTISMYSVRASDDAIVTSAGSTAEKKSYDGTTSNYHASSKIKSPIQIQILPEYINSLISGNISDREIYHVRPNSEFVFIDNQSGIISYAWPPFWNDLLGSCKNDFECSVNLTTGWQDNSSLQVSTTTTSNNTFSWIYGNELEVNRNERYELLTHMKLNNFAKDSHIAVEAYNKTLQSWKQIKQCPSGIDGPLEWHQFSCEIIIPDAISKIRPVLVAGWSSQAKEQAKTFFDDINLIRLTDIDASNSPTISDLNLMIEVVAEGLELPTGMAFLGPDDILVLEKEKGTVRRVMNGSMLPEPVLDVNVGSGSTRGMLGIAIPSKNESGNRSFPLSLLTPPNTYVFLYFTESKDSDEKGKECSILSNRLYRYELENNKLVNPKLLLELPATSQPTRNGGAVAIGPDKNVYTVVGDLGAEDELCSITKGQKTKAQNYRDGPDPDGRSGIIRVTQDGQLVNGTGILGDKHPLDMYYAYGIRNSFGMDFDPITGKLWDTENGPSYGDEINLVEPGFNSGWQEVVGTQESSRIGDSALVADNLEDFGGKGNYSDPEYEWSETVGPTALEFLDSDKLGKKYEDDMFVADINNGNIYHFELNKERTKLTLDSALKGRVNEKIIFAQGFGGITDIEVGPDGYLYVVSSAKGKIFRIIPQSTVSGITRYELSSFWNDPKGSCKNDFECSANLTTGWQDNSSLQVATKATTNNTWSWIYSKELEVNPNERYELVTHMKLNDFAKDSHVAVEAYNETLKNWKQIKQCPSGTDGPIGWSQFSCEIVIPESTEKIRLAFNAGWSSQAKEQAKTFFDEIYLIRLTDVDTTSSVSL